MHRWSHPYLRRQTVRPNTVLPQDRGFDGHCQLLTDWFCHVLTSEVVNVKVLEVLIFWSRKLCKVTDRDWFPNGVINKYSLGIFFLMILCIYLRWEEQNCTGQSWACRVLASTPSSPALSAEHNREAISLVSSNILRQIANLRATDLWAHFV